MCPVDNSDLALRILKLLVLDRQVLQGKWCVTYKKGQGHDWQMSKICPQWLGHALLDVKITWQVCSPVLDNVSNTRLLVPMSGWRWLLLSLISVGWIPLTWICRFSNRYVHQMQKMCWVQDSESPNQVYYFQNISITCVPYVHGRILKVQMAGHFCFITEACMERNIVNFCLNSL